MNLRQAYDGWSQQEQNRTLYVKTRDAFRKAWFTLPTNKPCSWYDRDVLALALAETRVVENDKVKAASVMVHVLTWANFAEPKYNPAPSFTTEDVTRLIRLPADQLERERQRITAAIDGPHSAASVPNEPAAPSVLGDSVAEPTAATEPTTPPITEAKEAHETTETSNKPNNNETSMTNEKSDRRRGREPRSVVQIDPESLQVIKTFDSISAASRAVAVKDISKGMTSLQKSGGYYWAYAEQADETLEQLRQKQAAAREPKPKKARRTTVKPSAAQQALAVFTDDELLDELDRRGWSGELQRVQLVTLCGA